VKKFKSFWTFSIFFILEIVAAFLGCWIKTEGSRFILGVKSYYLLCAYLFNTFIVVLWQTADVLRLCRHSLFDKSFDFHGVGGLNPKGSRFIIGLKSNYYFCAERCLKADFSWLSNSPITFFDIAFHVVVRAEHSCLDGFFYRSFDILLFLGGSSSLIC
jgi:hypothetical protein